MSYLRLRLFWLGLLLIPFHSVSRAQTASGRSETDVPDWVLMLDDSTTNYYEAVKAYERYWEGRENPLEQIEEREKYGYSPEREAALQREFQELSPEGASWRQEMVWQCKRFEEWQRDVLPFVQNDGRILTPAERRAMDEERSRQLKAAEGKEGQR